MKLFFLVFCVQMIFNASHVTAQLNQGRHLLALNPQPEPPGIHGQLGKVVRG